MSLKITKNTGALLFFFLIPVYSIWSQSSVLYALQASYSSNGTTYELAAVDPVTGNSTSLFEVDNLFAASSGSSTFDILNKKYVFWGVEANAVERLYSLDINQQSTLSNPTSVARPLELEIDLQTGTVYGLAPDPLTHEPDLVQVDLSDGSTDLIAELEDVSAVEVGSSAFDANGNRYFFQGIDQSFQDRLFSVEIATGELLANPLINQDASVRLSSFQYDLVSDRLLALQTETDFSDFNPQWQAYYERLYLVEVDPFSGAAVTLSEDPFWEGYLPGVAVGGVAFDQENQLLFVHAASANEGKRLLTVDTQSGELLNVVEPAHLYLEIQCDNLPFAERFFNISSAFSAGSSASLGAIVPNPFVGNGQIHLPEGADQIIIIDANGRTFWIQEQAEAGVWVFPSGTWADGLYFIHIQKGAKQQIIKSVKTSFIR